MKQKQSYIVGIAGGTGAGKTFLADMIKTARPEDTVVLSCDNYYKSLYDLLKVQNLLSTQDIQELEVFLKGKRPNVFFDGQGMTEAGKNQGVLKFLEERNQFEEVKNRINFDLPEDIDFELLANHLKELQSGRSVPRVEHHFKWGGRSFYEEDKDRIEPKPIIIVEGLMILSDPDLRLLRRFARDIKPKSEGGRDLNLASEIKRYEEYVLPGWRQYVEPTRRYADMTLNSEKDGSFKEFVRLLSARIDSQGL
ncbi:MAG: hypothetical protein IIU43_08150 [Thermoguttaceae bacterium]|nr:hypothetical protein [Thermoguttaceae bacterium]